MLRRISRPAVQTTARTLRKIKPPKKNHVVVLDPTPYRHAPDVDVARRFDRTRLQFFYYWLWQNWEPTFQCPNTEPITYADFARGLGVHRVVGDEWIRALITNSALRHKSSLSRVERVELVPMWPSAQETMGRYRINLKITPYDPWTDRSWDQHFSDPWFPYFLDEIVDDHYSVFTDEHLAAYDERRIRPDGKPFRPMKDLRHEKDHPLVFLTSSRAAEFRQKNGRPIPPPLHRKREIHNACSGQTLTAGPRPKGQQPEFRSWLGFDFDGAPPIFGRPRDSDSPPPQAAPRLRVRGKRPDAGSKATGHGLRTRRGVAA